VFVLSRGSCERSHVFTRSMRCPRELLQASRHRRVRLIAALLASASLALVLADARPPALFAIAPPALVLADARAPALLALAPDALVLADTRPPALLCMRSFGAGAGRCSPPRTPCIRSFRAGAGRYSPPRTPCIGSFGAGAGRCSPPPHSLHSLLLRWCWHRLAPPHSLHRLLWRWCGQTLRGFFFFAAPAPAALASSRLPRLRVLLLPTRAASSGPARCVLSPASSPMSPGPSSHKSIFKTAVYVCVHQISPYVCVWGGGG
jgi:hypothetical protein